MEPNKNHSVVKFWLASDIKLDGIPQFYWDVKKYVIFDPIHVAAIKPDFSFLWRPVIISSIRAAGLNTEGVRI